MTLERWEQIKEIFDSALEHPSAERLSFVRTACVNDDCLFEEIAGLLDCYDKAGDSLDGFAPHTKQVFNHGVLVCDRYRIVGLIGSGGMGEVYKAHDEFLNEWIALKTLRSDLSSSGTLFRRFQQEIQLVRKVTHKNVCRIFEVGVHAFADLSAAPVHFFTMELLEGATLSELIRRRGQLSASEAFPLIAQLAMGLDAIHEAGIIHGDFKTNNVILSGDRAIITDFGLAQSERRPTDDQRASTIMANLPLAGTIAYMSPEQITGAPVTQASDIYSFGIVLFEMATGQLPFSGQNIVQSALQRAAGRITEVRSLAPDIDPDWEFAIKQCLKLRPEERYRSTGALAHALQTGKRPSIRGFWSRKKRSWIRKTVLATAILLIAVTLFAFIWRLQYRKLEQGSKIVVIPTVNATGEGRFDGLAAAIRADLDQSSRLVLWDNGQLSSILLTMRRESSQQLSANDWREIAFRTSAQVLVYSTLSSLGDGYALNIRCEQIGKSPDPAERTWDHTFAATGPNGLFETVHEAASWVRTITGETLAEVSAHNRLPQDITSSSWEALQLYENAEGLAQSGRAPTAIPVLRRAVQLDPQFAMALMRLGDILNAQRMGESGFEYWREAIRQGRAQHLSDHERLSLESRYLIEVGDLSGAEAVLRQWAGEFPNDRLAAELLQSCLIGLGRYPEAITAGQRIKQQFGPSLFSTSRMIDALAMSHQWDQLGAELETLKGLHALSWERRFRGMTLAMRGDYDNAETAFRDLAGSASGEELSRTTSLLAALAADRGDLEHAVNLLHGGIAVDRESGEDGLAAQKAAALGFVEYIRGRRESSRNWALEAVAISTSPRIVIQAVSILSRQGFVEDANRIAARMPAGEGPNYEGGLLRMRGEILAAKGQFESAVETLEQAARRANSLQPKEYFARVLALSGQSVRARMAYSEIINTPWLVWNYPESEFPGLRLLAKQYLDTQTGG